MIQGRTCLHTAAVWDNVAAVNWLLLHGVDQAVQDKQVGVDQPWLISCSACVIKLLGHAQSVLVQAVIDFLCNMQRKFSAGFAAEVKLCMESLDP